ncbi:hypothetical protein CN984_12685 [Bacillus cereus]|uniref:Uncharacterized protein n=1 Tax=Bacillus cereus TaxID=1396 RepID=A0A2A7FNH3_BACCE|nr:hypothetical protein [Bacillus cereus]PEA25884.1 hypothetical protein CON44_18270 [Bacillus cereus]PGO29274.1 hypothetical protein CN984_12685 [Bacillus cereus]
MDKFKAINQDTNFFKEQLKQCLYEKQIMIKENDFWEQFSDHLLIAFAFLCLGIIIGIFIITLILRYRVKLDYDIPKGTILRVTHEDRKWLIIRPKSFIQVFDIVLLSMCDRGSDRYVDKHDRKRIRLLRIILFIILILLVLTGVLEVLSAFAWSMNPFDYIHRLQ